MTIIEALEEKEEEEESDICILSVLLCFSYSIIFVMRVKESVNSLINSVYIISII